MTELEESPGPRAGTAEPRGRRRDPRRAATRELILEASGQVFATRGFEGATLKAIAASAGVRQSLLVYHFESKDQLFKDCVSRLFARVAESVSRSVESAGDVAEPEALRAMIRSFVKIVAREPNWLQILLREGASTGPRLDWLVDNQSRSTFEAGTEMLRRAQTTDVLPPGLWAEHLLYVLVGAATFVLAIAPEVEKVTGQDVSSDAFIDRHIATLTTLFIRQGPNN